MDEDRNFEELEELQKLVALVKQCDGIDDWEYGVELIRHSAFREFVRELVEETYPIKELPWFITDHIDWEEVASEVAVDYCDVEFDGIVYWVR
jgi:hypothetical protein